MGPEAGVPVPADLDEAQTLGLKAPRGLCQGVRRGAYRRIGRDKGPHPRRLGCRDQGPGVEAVQEGYRPLHSPGQAIGCVHCRAGHELAGGLAKAQAGIRRDDRSGRPCRVDPSEVGGQVLRRHQQQEGSRRRGACGGRKARRGFGHRLHQGRGLRRQARGGKAAPGEAGDVLPGRQVGFSRGLEARDPPPGQGVTGRVCVDEPAQEEIRPQGPGQSQGEDPDRGEPHACVVVQVSGLGEFAGPVIEALDAGAARLGVVEGPPVSQAIPLAVARLQEPRPGGRPHFQPALPVGAPEYLLDELVRTGGTLGLQDRVDHLCL